MDKIKKESFLFRARTKFFRFVEPRPVECEGLPSTNGAAQTNKPLSNLKPSGFYARALFAAGVDQRLSSVESASMATR
jgi:hypothetical protein